MEVRIIVLGANGMAGHMIADYLIKNSDYYVITLTREECDFLDDNVFDVIFNAIKPAIIINCVGILNTKANKPEHKSEAIYINSMLPHILTEYPAKVIHLSSDCVFSGNAGPYDENCKKDAHDVYGQTKGLGELYNKKDLTLRTSIIGPELKNGTGLFHWIMNQLTPVSGFSHVIWGGVTTLELAKAIHYSIERNITGLFHLTNGHPISKLNLLELINTYFKLGLDFIPSDSTKNNRALFSSKEGFGYVVPSYSDMILDLANYMEDNPKYEKYYADTTKSTE